MTDTTAATNGRVKLNFTSYDVIDLSSLAPYFGRDAIKCGIYVLRFVNGSAYVGQTVDVVNRFSKHSRDWNRKLPDIAIEKVEFAACDQGDLDKAEQLMVAELEQTVTLHNKRLTNWPGGRGDLEIRRVGTSAIRIPADRAQRQRLKAAPKNSKLRRYMEFAYAPETELLTKFVGMYLSEAMPSPEETAGSMWTCTALPTTGDNARLLTLNAGGLEILYSLLEGPSLEAARIRVYMNVAVPEDRTLDDLEIEYPICEATVKTYRSETVWRWNFDLEALADPEDSRLEAIFERHLRHENELFDLAYALNKRLMAKQPSMWIPSHNPYLASDLLVTALAVDSVAEDQ